MSKKPIESDLERIDAMKDEDIDDSDIPELDDDFLKKAKVVLPPEKKQYKSEAFAAVHETMDALYQIGAIGKKTMRDFDKACLADALAV